MFYSALRDMSSGGHSACFVMSSTALLWSIDEASLAALIARGPSRTPARSEASPRIKGFLSLWGTKVRPDPHCILCAGWRQQCCPSSETVIGESRCFDVVFKEYRLMPKAP